MPTIVLKIDVDTYRGTREGVPNLVRILKQYQVGATFLFSLGKDHTGWAMRRIFRSGFFNKVSRTSVLEHYGFKTLMHGLLLPAPHIGNTCIEVMRATRRAGFECGIHSWDHVEWQDKVRHKDLSWTMRHMQLAASQFQKIFGVPSKTHGAAGWQMNEHAFAQLDQMRISYASDGRCALHEDGSLIDPTAGPYRLQGENSIFNCIQMPTTLPTLDELLGREINGKLISCENVASYLLKLTEEPRDHVFTLHAELEGQKLASVLIELIEGWSHQGYQCISMAQLYKQIKGQELPVFPISWAQIPGRSGTMFTLAPEFKI